MCANAGVDASNAAADGDVLILLPATPTPRRARCALARCPARPAVVVADSFGRAWRHGQCDVAIGVAGLAPLDDWRGRRDADGRELRATWIAVADQAAAAADLVRAKDGARAARWSCAASSATSPTTTGPARRRSCAPRAEDLFR